MDRKKNTHYNLYDNVEAMDVIKKMLTKEELKGAYKFNILKYQLRLGKKDDVKKEIAKIQDYQKLLENLE